MMNTIKEYIDFRFVGVALTAAILAACNAGTTTVPTSSGGTTGTQSTSYIQIERLGRPAIKEAFQMFTDHDGTNRSSPYSDSTLPAAIVSFTNTFRAPAYGTALRSFLIPDELQADLSQSTATGAYLGVETGGATGNKFGGRNLNDDVIDTSLGAIFGSTLTTLGLVATDDGQEIPCLTTDNEPGSNTADGNSNIAAINAKNHVTTTFPFIGTPN